MSNSILAQFPGPVRLTATKGMLKVILICVLVLEFVSVKAVITGQGVPVALLGLVIFLLWPILHSTLLLLRAEGWALTLDRDGFTIQYLLRPRTFAWSEVGDFAAWKHRAFDLMIYNDRSFAKGVIEGAMSKFRKLRFGRDAALPDTYNLGAERLARLMSLWQQRALSKQQ